MNNLIVWVYGARAAGKETFIRKITTDKPEEVINELGWNGKNVIACEESLRWIGQYDGDPKVEQRKQIPKIVAQIAKEKHNIVILIKGQDVDLENNLPVQLCDMLPDCEHKIVFLKAEVSELYTRGQRKVWWRPENTEQTAERWLNYQMELLKKISARLPITAVASDTADYRSIALPEKLY